MKTHILREAEIRSLIGPREALGEVRDAFAQLARGQATQPAAIGFEVAEHRGEVHVKAAYLHDAPIYAVKIASGFYNNPAKGLPVTNGAIVVFDASTGFLRAVLLDNGYLTQLRTGAGGGLAADLLARKSITQVGIVGCGSQARYQLEALLVVRRFAHVLVFGRSFERAQAFAAQMAARHGLRVTAVHSARQAVEGSEVVVTTTPSREPIVQADWIAPGTHITAMGSDGPGKRELDARVLAKADKVVADRIEQCFILGELQQAAVVGLTRDRVYAELGELAAGLKPGRTREDEVTVADLTGVGVQDAAVAGFVIDAANHKGIGTFLET